MSTRGGLARLSCAALAASGLAGVLMPERVADALALGPGSGAPLTGRGRLEVRAGLGATYVALATWALLADDPVAHRAVGMAWLGAGVTRAVSTVVDRPATDPVHWGSLALEIGGGLAGVLSRRA